MTLLPAISTEHSGLKVIDLPGEHVLRAHAVIHEQPRLTIHDGLAFALAESHEGCILLTGDGGLRAFAAAQKIEVRGVLWLINEIHRHGAATARELPAALEMLAADPTVRLPSREMAAFIRRYTRLQ